MLKYRNTFTLTSWLLRAAASVNVDMHRPNVRWTSAGQQTYTQFNETEKQAKQISCHC